MPRRASPASNFPRKEDMPPIPSTAGTMHMQGMR